MTEAAIEEQPQDVTALESALILRSRRAHIVSKEKFDPITMSGTVIGTNRGAATSGAIKT